jgi:hypothetical protein
MLGLGSVIAPGEVPTAFTKEGVLYTPISAGMPDKDQRQRLMPFLGKCVRVTFTQLLERSSPAQARSRPSQLRKHFRSSADCAKNNEIIERHQPHPASFLN